MERIHPDEDHELLSNQMPTGDADARLDVLPRGWRMSSR